MKLHFYHCNVCGKTIAVLSSDNVPTVCCGLQMEELIPGTADGSTEKHIPVAVKDGNHVYVTVGAILHPMTEEHSIKWIGLATEKGFQFNELHPGNMPKTEFVIAEGDVPKGAFSYCSIHGLWYSDIKPGI